MWGIPTREWVLAYVAVSVLFFPVGLRFGWPAAAVIGNVVAAVWFVVRVRQR